MPYRRRHDRERIGESAAADGNRIAELDAAPACADGGGILGGVCLGLVPFAGMGEGLLDGTGALPPSTPEFQRGKALGLMAAGLAEMAGGAAGEVVGGLLSATGIGAAVGVPAIAVSTVVVVGGAANVMAGLAGLMSSGSGSSNPREPPQGQARPTRGEETPGGLKHTTHSSERAVQRGFSDKSIDDIVRNNSRSRIGKVDELGRKTWEYSDRRGNTVVTNEAGEIVTVFSPAEGGGYITKP
jgi:hypothetical protein